MGTLPTYPQAPIGLSGYDSDAATAKTLTLVAIVVQLVFFLIGLLAIGGAALFAVASSPTIGFGFLAVILGVAFSVSILWIALDYFLIYKNLASGNVANAETPSLVLGILQLIFGGVVAGILLIIAYIKIRDSLQKRRSIPSQV